MVPNSTHLIGSNELMCAHSNCSIGANFCISSLQLRTRSRSAKRLCGSKERGFGKDSSDFVAWFRGSDSNGGDSRPCGKSRQCHG